MKTKLTLAADLIPYGRQDISDADIDAVMHVLRSEFLTQGPIVPQFEKAVSHYCGARHGVAVNSATSALHIACLALGLGPDDWLWTSPNTFVASANCAIYCGARVDFIDIDPQTYNISLECLKDKLEQADKAGRLPKIVIPVHFAGQPCDMLEIHKLSVKYGFKIVEDASHAIGSRYTVSNAEPSSLYVPENQYFSSTQSKQVKIGSCSHSHITVFSFHPVKIITTGEGGMAMTNDPVLAESMRRLRAHGITNEELSMHDRPNDEIWNYQQIDLGFNYRITDMQAALGLSQIQRLDDFIRKRNEIALRYDVELAHLPITTPYQKPGSYSSRHLYPIRLKLGCGARTQREVYDALWKNGVAANLHYIPVHRHPFYERHGFKLGDFPESERFHKEAISIPIFPKLNSECQTQVIKLLEKIFSNG